MVSTLKVSIAEIQGDGFFTPLADRPLKTQGIVTGYSRRGFFIQDPQGSRELGCSSGIFVYSKDSNVKYGDHLEVEGIAIDYLASEFDRPVTQFLARNLIRLEERSVTIEPVWINADILQKSNSELATFLNAHEGMLMGIEAGATFIAPSNPFADYVVLPINSEGLIRTSVGGVVVDAKNPDQWFPSFRMVNYDHGVQLNVGAKLRSTLTGPLHYRAKSFQLAINGPMEVEHSGFDSLNETVSLTGGASTRLKGTESELTVLTLNGFNLDMKVESARLVQNARRDIDDDLGDERFRKLAESIVVQAGSPDIIALQEIQDSDGAEITEVVHANKTYETLIHAIKVIQGPAYEWVDIPPEAGADGGQPGGNIRNAYLYNPARVALVEGSLCLLGEEHSAFEGSRKPLMASFQLIDSQANARVNGATLTVINVHLASKRHQRGIFAIEQPGYDERLPVRLKQAEVIRNTLSGLIADGKDYYLTGDFNDSEFSETLIALLGDTSVNLVEALEAAERYDYNHRGKLQSLMHGVISNQQFQQERAQYEILHGNELQGVKPGQLGEKASDHAYVIAKLSLAALEH